MISVIIPTLNEEKYLENTLRSIRSQNYKKKFEIIVADSLSEDKTVKIAKKYADKVISVKKRSASACRNAGAKAARGSILVFVDADTLIQPNLFETIDWFFKKRDIVAAIPPILPRDYGEHGEHFILYTLGEEIKRFLLRFKKPMLSAACMACRRQVFEAVGCFNEDLKLHEDVDLGLRLKNLGKIKFMNGTVAFTSMRRVKKWGYQKAIRTWLFGYFDFIKAWLFGYFDFKYKKKKIDYRPIR